MCSLLRAFLYCFIEGLFCEILVPELNNPHVRIIASIWVLTNRSLLDGSMLVRAIMYLVLRIIEFAIHHGL